MAGHLQHLKARNGRFPASVVVHWALRPCLGGKAGLEVRLGGDRRVALRKHEALQAFAETSIAIVTRFQRDGGALHPLPLPH